MNQLRHAKAEMIEAAGRTAQTFGLNRLLGQIYCHLYLSPEPLCLDDLVERLGMSKASISIACRQLQSWGAVRQVWKKGDRKDYYEAETDFGRLLDNGLLASLSKKLESAGTQIERSMQFIDESGEDGSEATFARERLEKANNYRKRIEGLLNNPIVRKIL